MADQPFDFVKALAALQSFYTVSSSFPFYIVSKHSEKKPLIVNLYQQCID